MTTRNRIYLTKKASGYYYLGYFDDNKKKLRWVTTGEKRKPLALEFVKSFNPNPEQTRSELNLSQLLDLFSRLQGSSLRERTLSLYKDAATEFIRVLGDRVISLYTAEDIESYKQQLLSRGLATTSVNIRFRSVRAIFGFAVRHEYLTKNPFSKSSEIKTAQKLPVYLSKEDLQKLLDKVTSPLLKDLFLFGALTGMRLGEILSLKFEAIDWQKAQVTVLNSEEFTTKNGKVRVIPAHPIVLDMLKRRAIRAKGTDLVFAKPSGHSLTISHVSHQFRFFADEANLDKRYHTHSLRHTFASWLVQSGVSIYEIQKLLGHSQLKVTMIYAALSQSRLAESVNRLVFE